LSDSQGTPTRRATRTRATIRHALDQLDTFVSAQQLHSYIAENDGSVGLATVYRTLQLLASDGDVDALRDDDGEMLYRKCDRGHHHHHLICRECGKTVEIGAKEIETWADSVAKHHGFTSVDHMVELFGYCSDCA